MNNDLLGNIGFTLDVSKTFDFAAGISSQINRSIDEHYRLGEEAYNNKQRELHAAEKTADNTTEINAQMSDVVAQLSKYIKVLEKQVSIQEHQLEVLENLFNSSEDSVLVEQELLKLVKHEIDEKFDEIVKFSGIENFLDTPVRRYSSGMYVRLGFAVAAHLEPEILLIDEVLAVGDAEFQKKCLSKMNDIAKGGRTIIFVSHNMNAVRELCNKCVWLKDGKVYKQGPSEQIVDDYLRETAIGAGVFPIVAPLDPLQIDSMTASFEGDDLVIENKISSSALVSTVEVVNIIKTNTSEMIAKANFVNTNVAVNNLNGSATVLVRFPGLKKMLTNGHYYIDAYLNNPYIRTYVSRTKALEFTIDDKKPINSRENSANNFGLLNISPTSEVK
jgi:ABC-type glutathione transport system ATPase component